MFRKICFFSQLSLIDPNGNILTYTRNGDAARLSMDDLSYFYTANTNRLHKVTDAAADASPGDYSKYNDIKQGQADDNYQYDEIGNLVADNAEGITNVTWNVYGKISSITKSDSLIRYVYDAAGNRIMKQTATDTTIYVRDAAGNVVSVYTKPASGTLMQSEMHLYGSSRLGMATLHSVPDTSETLSGGFASGIKRIFIRGEKLFELSNHLGNVLVTVTDRKIAVSAGGSTIDYYTADISSANDYYPFGMQQPGRKFNAGNYRFGFNGKEQDKETTGTTTYDYGFRIYNQALGRFLSVDPLFKTYPWYTPFQFAGNKPIIAIDIDGLEEELSIGGDPGVDAAIGIINSAIDGIGNMFAIGGEWIVSDSKEGEWIRSRLLRDGYSIPSSISNKQLGELLKIRKRDRQFVIEPESSVLSDLLDLGISALDVVAITPMKGSVYFAGAKATSMVAPSVSGIIKSLRISARTKEITETFMDLTRGFGQKISKFEAESGAILEESHNLSLRQIRQGEAGDFAIAQGTLNGQNVAGKTIDQLGIPAEAIGKFKVSDLTASITAHFNKKGVDFILLDGRNLSQAQRTEVMNFVKKNHAQEANRLITIGFE